MIHFFELDPENEHGCHRCQLALIDLSKTKNGAHVATYLCKQHGDVGMNHDYNYVRPNDCPDFLSAWQNDYRKRPDLQRKLDKKEGGKR